MTKPIFIAEVKTKSPFGWQSDQSWDELFKLANQYGDWLSIHTDERWGGSFDLLAKARKRTKKPILAKGIHKNDAEITRAIEAGADYVLVVGRLPKVHLDKCLIEPLSLSELTGLPKDTRAVWNQRDLNTGQSKSETFETARKAYSGWLAQASYLEEPSDVADGADAIIVGTHLADFTSNIRDD